MNSIPKLRAALLLTLLVVALGATSALSQGETQPVLRTHVISTNPILDVFTWYNLEWEMRISQRGTIGLFGSYITLEQDIENPDPDEESTFDEKYYSVTAFYRYYPTQAFKGFFIGGRFGYYHVEGREDETDAKAEGEFMGVGVDVGYGWLLGEPQRVAIGIGIGAVRLFGGDLEDVQATLPTIRFINVGIAF